MTTGAAKPYAAATDERPVERKYLAPGTGTFTRGKPSSKVTESATGTLELNFENENIRKVVKIVLGDILKENYYLDPRVEGGVTLQTSRPLTREALIPTLEMLLRMNGAALVLDKGIYKAVPVEEAAKGLVTPVLGDASMALPAGYAIRIVPLRYVAASEMHKILKPISHAGSIVRADSARNLMVLAGTSQELSRLMETVNLFDVDWLAGMSVALLPVDYAEAKTLAKELDSLFDSKAEGPFAGLVRVVAIERLNALLVVTPRPEYLEKVADWVARLDRDTGDAGRRLYIYHVQNGRATDLAEVLGQVFESEEAKSAVPPRPDLAPGSEPVEIRVEAEKPKESKKPTRPTPRLSTQRISTQAMEGLTVQEGGGVRIIPDEINNALLILATTQEYKQVEAALRKLDIVPLQVLIEATIAEITLTDDLRYGLEWFFKNNLGRKGGEARLDLDTALGLDATVPGFSYAITVAEEVRAVLNMLAEESKVNIVSSPSLMVLNNQQANIQVGDEISLQTQQQTATASSDTVLSTFERRSTGVQLSVTPRVNAGGLVTMEIQQEVSEVGDVDANGQPTILQRKIESTVAVQSGETVVLGGLIRENRTLTESGVPVLHTIPVLGALFGQTEDDRRRTELVVLITPRAVQSAHEARQVTEEFYRKMQSLKPLEEVGGKTPP